MISFKTFAIAAAILSGAVFSVPTSSQAVPRAAPVKIAAGSYGNLVEVHYRRYCRHGRCYDRYHRYSRYREYQRSFYNCPPFYGYYLPYYGADRPCRSYYQPYYRADRHYGY